MLFKQLNDMYEAGQTLKDWSETNVPAKDLIAGGNLSHQCRKVNGVGALLKANARAGKTDFEVEWIPVEPRVVGHHSSKSVKLPVTCMKFHPFDQVVAYVFLRDNFYDIKVCVVSDSPITLPYELVHWEWSEAQLEKEKEKYRNYIPSEEKDKKLASGSDDWYSDWSSGELLRKDGRIYRASSVASCYCEGINRLGLLDEVFQVYQDDMKLFSCSLGSYGRVVLMLDHVQRSLERERTRRNDIRNEERRRKEREDRKLQS